MWLNRAVRQPMGGEQAPGGGERRPVARVEVAYVMYHSSMKKNRLKKSFPREKFSEEKIEALPRGEMDDVSITTYNYNNNNYIFINIIF